MKKTNRVAVIGMGLVSPQGTGIDEVLQNKPCLPSFRSSSEIFGKEGLKSGYNKVTDSFANAYLPSISMQYTDGITRYAGIASSMAIGKYLPYNSINPSEVGMALGTSLGSIVSISGFDLQSLNEGPSSVRPMEFPNTVSNAPTSKVGIWFKLKGPSVTISNGFTSSTDAMGFAFEEISCGRVGYYLAGGSEEISDNVYHGYTSSLADKRVSPSKIALAGGSSVVETVVEGSGMLLLCSMGEAKSKGLETYGEITDFVSIKLSTDRQYVETVLDIITTMIGNSDFPEEDIMLYSSYLPFNEFACTVYAEVIRCFGKERLITHNSLDGVSANYLGLSGVFNAACALEDLAHSKSGSRGALVFDIGCDGKFSGIFIKKI